MQVFFAEIEYAKSKEVFARLNTKSLPYIFHVGTTFNTEGAGTLRVASTDTMQVPTLDLLSAPPPDHLPNRSPLFEAIKRKSQIADGRLHHQTLHPSELRTATEHQCRKTCSANQTNDLFGQDGCWIWMLDLAAMHAVEYLI